MENAQPHDTSVLSLPTELLDEIFSYFPDQRHVLGPVRLSCRTLNESASKYFITRATFAMRMPSWIRLHWLLSHEYFSKTVTEFFYDASLYQKDTPAEYAKIDDDEGDILRSPRQYDKLQTVRISFCTPSMWTQARTLDEYIDRPEDAHFVYDTQCAELDARHVALEESDDFEPEYYRQYLRYQELVMRSTFTQFTAVTNKLLLAAFRNFTKLRCLTIGDFRSFAYDNESYEDMCQRLFGDSLEPSVLHDDDSLKIMQPEFIINALKANPGLGITTFKTASHPFEVRSFDTRFYDCHSWQMPTLIEYGVIGSPGSYSDCMEDPPSFRHPTILCNLTEIKLAFLTSPHFNIPTHREHCRDALVALLKASSLTLQSLSLHYGDSNMEHDLRDYMLVEFNRTIGGRHFPRLERLHLKGWFLETSRIKDFLLRHKDSLRFVHLDDNRLLGDQDLLEDWLDVELDVDHPASEWLRSHQHEEDKARELMGLSSEDSMDSW